MTRDVRSKSLIEKACICEFTEGCSVLGVLYCGGCGGDQCVCGACHGHGEAPCPGCDECDVDEWAEDD